MVADPGNNVDATAEGTDGDDGDVSWSEVHEASMTANLGEDHLTGDWVPEPEVVQDDEGDALKVMLSKSKDVCHARRHLLERLCDATMPLNGRTLPRVSGVHVEKQRPLLSEQGRRQ